MDSETRLTSSTLEDHPVLYEISQCFDFRCENPDLLNPGVVNRCLGYAVTVRPYPRQCNRRLRGMVIGALEEWRYLKWLDERSDTCPQDSDFYLKVGKFLSQFYCYQHQTQIESRIEARRERRGELSAGLPGSDARGSSTTATLAEDQSIRVLSDGEQESINDAERHNGAGERSGEGGRLGHTARRRPGLRIASLPATPRRPAAPVRNGPMISPEPITPPSAGSDSVFDVPSMPPTRPTPLTADPTPYETSRYMSQQALDDEAGRPSTPTPAGRSERNSLGRVTRGRGSQRSRLPLIQAMASDWSAMERQTGIVYVLQSTAEPGFLKIEWTSRTLSQRLDDPDHCAARVSRTVYESVRAFVGSKRVEKLVHKDLHSKNVTVDGCVNCGGSHREWFEASLEDMLCSIRTWTNFVNGPWYGRDGRFSEAGDRLLSMIAQPELHPQILALVSPPAVAVEDEDGESVLLPAPRAPEERPAVVPILRTERQRNRHPGVLLETAASESQEAQAVTQPPGRNNNFRANLKRAFGSARERVVNIGSCITGSGRNREPLTGIC